MTQEYRSAFALLQNVRMDRGDIQGCVTAVMFTPGRCVIEVSWICNGDGAPQSAWFDEARLEAA
jgi:hypothetical protein